MEKHCYQSCWCPLPRHTVCVCVCLWWCNYGPAIRKYIPSKIAINDGLTTIKYASVNSRSRGISKASTFHEGIIIHPLFPGHLPVFSMRYVAAMRFGLYRPVVCRGGGDGSGDVGLQWWSLIFVVVLNNSVEVVVAGGGGGLHFILAAGWCYPGKAGCVIIIEADSSHTVVAHDRLVSKVSPGLHSEL